jgi:hypothetical protein
MEEAPKPELKAISKLFCELTKSASLNAQSHVLDGCPLVSRQLSRA